MRIHPPEASWTPGSSSRGRNCPTARSTEVRSSVWTCVEARDGPAGASPRRASSASSDWTIRSSTGSNPSLRQTPSASSFDVSTSSERFETPCSRAEAEQARRSSFAIAPAPRARPHVHGLDVPPSGLVRRRLDEPDELAVVLGHEDGAAVGHVRPEAPSSPPPTCRARSPGARAPRPGTPPRARAARPCRRWWPGGCSRHSGGGQQVVGGEVLEGVEAGAELVHV